MGAPSHRVQNPVNPGKPASVGEALRTQGKGGSPTYSISAAAEVRQTGSEKAETPKGNLRQGKLHKTAGAGGRARHKVENQAPH